MRSGSDAVSPGDSSGRLVLTLTLLTLALFFSGFFVAVTPLPVAYFLTRRQGRDFFRLALPALLVVVVVYAVAVPLLAGDPEGGRGVFQFPIPGLAFSHILSNQAVSVIGIAYFGFYIALGLALYAAFANPPRFYQILITGVLASFLAWGFLAITLFWQRPEPKPFSEFLPQVLGQIEDGVQMWITVVEKEQPNLDLKLLVALKGHSQEIARYILYLQPLMAFLMVAGLYAFNTILFKRFFGQIFPHLHTISLARFRCPFLLLWGLLAVVAVLLVNVRVLHDDYLYFVLLNFVGAYGFAYGLQGLAVFLNFLETRRIIGLMRLICYLLVFLFLHFSLAFFVLLGFVDNWADFRKLDATATGGGDSVSSGDAGTKFSEGLPPRDGSQSSHDSSSDEEPPPREGPPSASS